MRRTTRSVAWILLFGVLGILLFIHTPFFEAMVRRDIEERVTRATGEPLRVGTLSISPFRGEIRVTDVKLSDTVSVGSLDLDVRILPLFLFRVEVEDALVTDVKIHVRLRPGRTGFRTDPMALMQQGFDSLLLHQLQVKGLSIHVIGREDLAVSAELPDFLLQAGFDGDRYAYHGTVAFTGGRVTVNGTPMLLDMGCRFAVRSDVLEILELTVTRGTIRLSGSGRWDSDGWHMKVNGTVPLRQLTDLPELRDTSVSVALSGGLDDLSGPVTVTDPRGTLTGRCSLDLEKNVLVVSDLTGSFQEHTVRLSGTWRFGGGGAADALMTVSGPVLADFRAVVSAEKRDRDWSWRVDITGRDSGNGQCHIEMISGQRPTLHDARLNLPFLKTRIKDNQGWLALHLDWADLRLDGEFLSEESWFSGRVNIHKFLWAGMDVPRAVGELVVQDSEHVAFSRVLLQSGEGTVRGEGYYRSGELTLSATLDKFPFHDALFAVPDTGNLAIDGRVTGSVSLTGRLDNPTVTGKVVLEPLSLFDVMFDRASAGFRFKDNVLTLDQPVLKSGSGFLSGGGWIDFNTDRLDIRMEGSGFRLVYRPLDFLTARDSAGTVVVSGTLERPEVRADLTSQRLTLEDISLGSGSIRVGLTRDVVRVDLETDRRLAATVKVDLKGPMQLVLTADRTPVTIDRVTGTGTLAFECAGNVNDPKTFAGTGTVSSFTLDLPEHISFAAEPFSLDMTGMVLAVDEIFLHHPDLDMRLSDGTLNLESTELTGVVTGSGTLRPFRELVKRETGLAAEGRLSWTIHAGGTLIMPTWSGDVVLSDGRLSIPGLDRPVTGVSGSLQADPALVRLDRISGRYGAGAVSIAGIVSGSDVGVECALDSIPVEQSGIFARLDGLVRVEGDPREDRLNLVGSVSLAHGIINPAQVMLGSGGEDVPVLRHLTLNLSVATQDLEISDDTMRLVLDRSVLKLSGPADNPIILGTQRIATASRIYLNEIPFQVTRGEIRFDNRLEIDPTVDIQAETRIQDVTVRCRLRGSGSNVQLSLSSTPPLRKQELMALLFGSGGMTAGGQMLALAPVSGPSADLTGAGAALVLNNLFAPLKRRVSRRLGVERFSITPQIFDARATPSPIVTFEKDISSRLTGTYSQSLIGSGDNLLQFRYRMAGSRAVVARKEIDGSVTLELEFHVR